MAGLIVHLVIAKEILSKLSNGIIKNEGLFYEGSIAPDAVHARPDYIREDKKYTHMREGILDKYFGNEDNLDLFHKRVSEFILTHRDQDDYLLDFYRGYVVHLLTDELYVLTLRNDFCKAMELMDIAEDDKEFFDKIIKEMYQNDYLLVENMNLDEIKQSLENVEPCHLEGYISEQEINKSRAWLINRYFVEKHELFSPFYISYESTLEFIQMAAGNIIMRLSEGGNLPQMF